MLKVAIVGCGYIAQAEHIPNWRQTPGAEIVALVDQRADLAQDVAGSFGIPAFASLSEALERTEADAVHVSTSLASHVPLAIQAAAAGKHVLVEKPLADNAETGADALAAARSAGVVLMVGYQKHADADLGYVGDLIESKRLGQLMGLSSVFRISQPPLYRELSERRALPSPPGAGVSGSDLHGRLLEQSAHHINMFNTWLPGGLRIDSVRGHRGLWSFAGAGPDGVVVHHHNAKASGNGEEFWAYFEGGSVHVQIWSPHFPATRGRVTVLETAADRAYEPVTPRVNPYLAMLRLFQEQVSGERPWEPAALTAVEDLRVIAEIESMADANGGPR